MDISLIMLAQVVVSGLLLGSVYALTACGLNLILGVMFLVNFAHGEIMMLAAYATFWLFTFNLLGHIASLVVTVPLMFVFGAGLQKYLFERTVGGSELPSLLLSFGLSFLFMNIAFVLWSADFRFVNYFSGSYHVGPLALPYSQLVTAGIALSVTGVVYVFLQRNRIGKAVRATAQNADAAQACGINVRRIRIVTFGLGTAMAGAAGSLLSMMYAFNPNIGMIFVLKAFAIVIMGGLGSYVGAFLAALILGVTEGLTGLYGTAQLSQIAAYLIIIIVLLVRPRGLLGRMP